MDPLRKYIEIHHNEGPLDLSREQKEECLFWECEIKSLRDATLKNCVLTKSKFNPETLGDLLNATVTLNCHTFGELEMNDLSFDFMLMLLARTRGNKEKRQAIIDHVIGRDRAKQLLKLMERL